MGAAKELERAAKMFEALGHPRRLELIQLLDGWSHSPAELARRLGCSWTTIGKHLDVLCDAGLVHRYEAEFGRGYAYATNRRGCAWASRWLVEFEAKGAP